MYKKITHTIVEEHFDHPLSNQIRKSISRFESRSGVPTTEIFDPTKFRSDLDNSFKNYATKLIEMTDAVTGTEESLVMPFEELFLTVDTAGNATKPFYPSELGEQINEALRSVALTVFAAVNSAKINRDPQGEFVRNGQWSNNLTNSLIGYNNSWIFNTIITVLNRIYNSLLAKIRARKEKNVTVEQELNKTIMDSLMEFSKLLADGIVTQYPNRFKPM